MANPFCDPMAETKLRNHPKTSGFMDDKTFQSKFRLLQQDPKNLMSMLSDPQVVEAMGVLYGVDLSSMGKLGGCVCMCVCARVMAALKKLFCLSPVYYVIVFALVLCL